MGRVIVLGSINIDLEVKVDSFPGPNEKVMGASFSRFAGGKGANQAVAAKEYGATVVMVGSVGDDGAGRACLNRLAAKGIQLAVDRIPNVPTGHAFITTDTHGVTEIVVASGANSMVAKRALDEVRQLGPEDIVLTQLETPVETVSRLMRDAIAEGARIVINLSPYEELPEDVVAYANPLIIQEKNLEAFQKLGYQPKSLLVTHGKDGITWDGINYPGVVVPAEDVVDTTGGSDAFVGTLVAALVEGKDNGEAAFLAMKAAAENVRHYGAQRNPRI